MKYYRHARVAGTITVLLATFACGSSPDDSAANDSGAPEASTSIDSGSMDAQSGDASDSAHGDASKSDASSTDGAAGFALVNYRGAADPEAADWVAYEQPGSSITPVANTGGRSVISVDSSRPLSVYFVCRNSSQVEVHLYHVLPAEVSMLTNDCHTPSVDFASEYKVPLTYSNLPSNHCGASYPANDIALCSTQSSNLWGYGAASFDYVHLAAIENLTGPYYAPSEVIVERKVPSAATPRSVDFATATATVPFSVNVSGAPASPNVYFVSANGTRAFIGPYSENLGGTVPCGGVPASLRVSGDQHFIHDLEAEDTPTHTASTELYAFVASPVDTTLSQPTRVLGVPTVSNKGSNSDARIQVDFTPMSGAVGYVLATYNNPSSGNTPLWTSFVSTGYLQNAASYVQPDLSAATGFQSAWLLNHFVTWTLAAVVTPRPVSDLIGDAHVVPSVPGMLDVMRTTAQTDGLQMELPQQTGMISQ